MRSYLKLIIFIIIVFIVILPACKSSNVTNNEDNTEINENSNNNENENNEDNGDNGDDNQEETFDINGTWTLDSNFNNNTSENIDVEYSGTNTKGDVKINGVKVGSYSISNNKINFSYKVKVSGVKLEYEYKGTIDGLEDMHGTVDVYQEQQSLSIQARVLIKSGTWKGKKKRTH